MQEPIKMKSKKSTWLRHGRYLHGAAMGTMGFCTSFAVDHTHAGGSQEWLQTRSVDLRMNRIPAKLKGTRIVHISDLHLGRTVSPRYLKHCLDRVNTLEPDIVVLTGDYITHDRHGTFRRQVAGLVGGIKSVHGVYASLGNHDYGMLHSTAACRDGVLEGMVGAMNDGGVRVLRNESTAVDIEGHVLWLVGMGDLWVGDFDPARAFAGVPAKEDAIVLSHNPRTIDKLHDRPVGVVMSGHTHGAQSSWSLTNGLSRKLRAFHSGMYEVGGRKLYVNRGLGRIGRARFNARPEITILTLR